MFVCRKPFLALRDKQYFRTREGKSKRERERKRAVLRDGNSSTISRTIAWIYVVAPTPLHISLSLGISVWIEDGVIVGGTAPRVFCPEAHTQGAIDHSVGGLESPR
ncbi:hypothetical protein MN608_06228 [Microdochium nivale]|nr:hypothetical protein MN608_06228 [Microdochium nivale]